MKALTIRQPWSWAIARGHKTIENRSWTTAYRGPLAIHSASRWDDDREYVLREVVQRIRRRGGNLPGRLADDLPWSDTGRVVAVVDLVDICTANFGCDCGPWAVAGQAHWQLANVRLVANPPTTKGRLGLWDLPAGVDVECREAVS